MICARSIPERLRGLGALLRLREAELLRAEALASAEERRAATLAADVRAYDRRREGALERGGSDVERLRLAARIVSRKVEVSRALEEARSMLRVRLRAAQRSRGRRDLARELWERGLAEIRAADERRRETAAGDAAAARRFAGPAAREQR